ncbi:hypothetical protein CPB85DRAFT_1308639 [Mucidula mucida]|nr:hypothetical protein CPB85DRAFT_1308639 [Mucidula mucida]
MSTAPKPPPVNTTGPPTPASSTTSSPTAKHKDPMSDLEEVVALMAKLKESEKTEAHNVASAGKVIKSSQKIETLRASLTEKRAKYIAAIDALEKDLHSKVEAALKDRLRQQVYKNIKESLQAQIDQKVREKLMAHIPTAIREQTATHKKRMAEIHMHLYNAEARRLNATLNPDQPLNPLLCLASPNAEEATAPAHFPANVNECTKLKDDVLKSLVKEYGLRDLSPVREEKINKFLEFIGVPFQCMKIVPSSGSSSPAGSKQARMFLLRVDKPSSKFV